MTYFKEIEGDCAILVSGGVYRQSPLYAFDGNLFAKHGGGFIRLATDGSTSKDKTSIVRLITNISLYRDRLGRLSVTNSAGSKPIPGESMQALLAPPVE